MFYSTKTTNSWMYEMGLHAKSAGWDGETLEVVNPGNLGICFGQNDQNCPESISFTSLFMISWSWLTCFS